MKLEPVTKFDKRKKTTSKKKKKKKIDDDIMSENFDAIVIFQIYVEFGAIRKPDSEHIVFKIYIFINSNLLCHKKWKQK